MNTLRKKLFPIAKDLTSIAKEIRNLPKDLIPIAKNMKTLPAIGSEPGATVARVRTGSDSDWVLTGDERTRQTTQTSRLNFRWLLNAHRPTMWNDTDIPLAVFFTFRCYGTWLHGDERGSADHKHNTYRSPKIPANTNWRKYNEQLLRHPP